MGKKRRGNNEGSIYKRKDGRWCAAVTVGFKPDGKPQRRYVYGGSHKEVATKLNALLSKVNSGTFEDPSRVTVGEFLRSWIENRSPYIAHSTFKAYAHKIRAYLAPPLGCIPLRRLRARDIQTAINDLHRKGLGMRTLGYVRQTLSMALKQATREELISSNEAAHVELPRPQGKEEMKTLTRQQVQTFLEYTKKSRLYALYLLAFSTGMRRGELLGTSWGNLDEGRGTLKITHQVIRGAEGIELTPILKTKSSHREITLPRSVLKALKDHRRNQAQEKMASRLFYTDRGLVFADPLGRPLDPDGVSKKFRKALEEAGLPRVRFHDCKHTCASLLLEAGASPKSIQSLLGHSSIIITLDTYSHITQDMQEQTADLMGGLLEKK